MLLGIKEDKFFDTTGLSPGLLSFSISNDVQAEREGMPTESVSRQHESWAGATDHQL